MFRNERLHLIDVFRFDRRKMKTVVNPKFPDDCLCTSGMNSR